MERDIHQKSDDWRSSESRKPLMFLDATGSHRLRELLSQRKDMDKLTEAFHQKLLVLLKQYFIVGGMPEVVATYDAAIQWLHDAGLIYYCRRLSKAGMPLRAFAEDGIFKVYALDVGLLRAMADLPPETLFRGSRVFDEFHGAFVENYVAGELKSLGQGLFYWESSGKAEVDFVFQTTQTVVSLEAKAGINVKSKSLTSFRAKHPELPRIARTNLLNFDNSGGIENYPLYAVSQAVCDTSRGGETVPTKSVKKDS